MGNWRGVRGPSVVGAADVEKAGVAFGEWELAVFGKEGGSGDGRWSRGGVIGMQENHRLLRKGRSVVFVATCLLALVVGTDRLEAQTTNPSVLTLLPPRDTVDLNSGSFLRNDQLVERDHLVRAGRRVAGWIMEAQEGESYQVDLRSEDFDAYLYIVGPELGLEGGESAITDDDSGDGLNASLCFRAPREGWYHVVTSALNGNTGMYSLQIEVGCRNSLAVIDELDILEVPEDEGVFDWWNIPVVGRVTRGIAQQGIFTSQSARDDVGRPVHSWILSVEEGQRLVIDLISRDFDAVLHLVTATEFGPLRDDDGRGVGTDSRICLIAPENAEYRVIASSFLSDVSVANGSYSLLVVDDPSATLCAEWRTAAAYHSAVLDEMSSADTDVLEIGDAIEGTFTRTESFDPVTGRQGQVWRLAGVAGESVTIDLRSEFYDSFLYLIGPGLEDGFAEDDDSGGGCDARISVQLSETAIYHIYAAYIDWVGLGEAYRLSVMSSAAALRDGTCEEARQRTFLATLPMEEDRRIAVGDEIEGQLTDEDRYGYEGPMQLWSVEAAADESLVAELESDDFDAYLIVLGPDDYQDSNDDGGFATNARLGFDAGISGVYRIVVVSYDGNTGGFRLRVVRSRL